MSSAHPYPGETAQTPGTPPSPVRHLLVLPDRDTAEAVAEEVTDRFALGTEPELVREALAGEDDAEDAQWLVVLEDPAGRLDPAELDRLAAGHEGWLEAE